MFTQDRLSAANSQMLILHLSTNVMYSTMFPPLQVIQWLHCHLACLPPIHPPSDPPLFITAPNIAPL